MALARHVPTEALIVRPRRSDPDPHAGSFCQRTRREFLWESGAGFGALGLAGLFGNDPAFGGEQGANAPRSPGIKFVNPMAPKPPMYPGKAKAVIFLFMYGGPSQVDTFDEKPELARLDGKTIPVKTFGRGGHKNQGRVVGPKFEFKNYGQCGKRVSNPSSASSTNALPKALTLPRLPPGTTIQSGVSQRSASRTRSMIAFCPSRRKGLMLLTR